MKLFIASDIHGSFKYCEKMLKAYDQEKADRMLLLGDILYHGPRNDLLIYTVRRMSSLHLMREKTISFVSEATAIPK